jgi:multicomponent Na+:H+ antiporter subunit D
LGSRSRSASRSRLAAVEGETLVYVLGGWAPPLGIALRADGLAVVMLLAVAVVICGIGVYARGDFGTPAGVREARAPLMYWLLLLAVWGSLNLVFVERRPVHALRRARAADVRRRAAGLPRRQAARRCAPRCATCCSRSAARCFYLLGAVLLYGAYGTLDIALLAAARAARSVAWAAAALMTTGLLAKTALFPLHIWLPPAHARRPGGERRAVGAGRSRARGSSSCASGSTRCGVVTWAAAQLLAGLGAAAIVVGSIVALRQERLKLLIAYSTVAQIGYLFLMFPLAFDAHRQRAGTRRVLDRRLLQAVSHATAKAAMFMAAGLIYAALGHDRIADLAGVARMLPVTVLAFALAGVALMGVVPSGAYLAKKLLLDAADGSRPVVVDDRAARRRGHSPPATWCWCWSMSCAVAPLH